MKSILATFFVFTALSFSSYAAEHNYECIASTLQSLNSDVYYNLTEAEIDGMLTIPEMMGHYDAMKAAEQCDK
jgi:hypothetical protein